MISVPFEAQSESSDLIYLVSVLMLATTREIQRSEINSAFSRSSNIIKQAFSRFDLIHAKSPIPILSAGTVPIIVNNHRPQKWLVI
jgi:hypothetical protein